MSVRCLKCDISDFRKVIEAVGYMWKMIPQRHWCRIGLITVTLWSIWRKRQIISNWFIP